MQLRASRLNNASGERLGAATANDYQFDTHQAELTALFGHGGFKLSATGYAMKYANYLYLGHSGLQTANRLPLKYWKQTDTTVKGFEVDASQAIRLGGYGKLDLAAFADLVRNKADHPDALRRNTWARASARKFRSMATRW